MKIIEPKVEFMFPIDGEQILKQIEQAGRVCYKSESNISDTSAKKFVRNIVNSGHEAVLEHASFTVKFTVDRAVSHEVIRHRIAAYCQESTRYCNYSKDKFGNEITVIRPCFWDSNSEKPEEIMLYNEWLDACERAEESYFELLSLGASPQEARAVLPNSLKTELIMTADVREWRHFLRLRCDKAAHPQMRQVACQLLEMCKKEIPVLFDDIDY